MFFDRSDVLSLYLYQTVIQPPSPIGNSFLNVCAWLRLERTLCRESIE